MRLSGHFQRKMFNCYRKTYSPMFIHYSPSIIILYYLPDYLGNQAIDIIFFSFHVFVNICWIPKYSVVFPSCLPENHPGFLPFSFRIDSWERLNKDRRCESRQCAAKRRGQRATVCRCQRKPSGGSEGGGTERRSHRLILPLLVCPTSG